MKSIFKLVIKEKLRIAVVIVISLITYYLTLYPVNKIGDIIDKLSTRSLNEREFMFQILYLLVMAISLYLIFYFKEYFIFVGEFYAQHEFGYITLNKLYNNTSDFFSKVPISEVISIVLNDITKYISFFFSIGLLYFVEGIIYNLVLTLMIFYKSNLKLTLLVIFPFIIQTVVLVLIKRNQRRDYKNMTESMDKIVKNTLENIRGIRVIKAYNMNEMIKEKFVNNLDEYTDKLLVYRMNFALLEPLILLSLSFSYFFLVIYGYHLINLNLISLGNIISISIIIAMLAWPYLALLGLIMRIKEFLEASKRVDKIMVEDDENDYTTDEFIFNFKDEIEFRDFSYKDILNDINFKIKKGQNVAIVGKIGSGKTTLIKQLIKLYKNEENNIFYDGICINRYNIKSIRDNIAYVPQDYMLFSESIKDNILFYRPLEDKLNEVLYVADLEKDIAKMPNNIDTYIGENGISLSGGQKQRISIARAIISNPEILILDDSLSAVDANTERHILERLREYRKGKTNIYVSHRISVVKNSDLIIVLNDGRISNMGTHNYLLEHDNWYRKTCNYQNVGEINEER